MNSPEALSSLLDAVPEPAFIKTSDHRWVRVNTAFCDLMGLPESEIVGKSDLDLFSPSLAIQFSSSDDQVITSGRPLQTPWRIDGTDRRRRKGRMEARTHKNVIVGHNGERFILGIVRDVTEIAIEQETLRDELETAKTQASRKSVFLASLGHEIRTPLQAMLEAARQLEELVAAGPGAELASLMRRSGRELLELVEDILDLSQLESGHARLRDIPFDLPALVQECVALFEPMVRIRGGRISFEPPAHPLPVRGDPVRLRQILSNLLGNAVRYAGHAAIRVELEFEGRTSSKFVPFVLRVVDEGPGFTAEEGALLFERWRRGGTNQKGSGLGLAIVKQTVEAMGGSIRAEGRPGKGATFVVRLKLPRAGHQLDLFNAWTETASENEDLRLDAPSEVPRPAAPTAANPSSLSLPDRDVPRNGLNILLVEDNRTNQVVLRTLLHKLHHRTILAENGTEALDRLESSRSSIDIVLMDCQMPVMDGFEATRRWRTREIELGLGRKPILAVTALNLESTREECLLSGMDDVLTKPIHFSTLQQALGRWNTTALG